MLIEKQYGSFAYLVLLHFFGLFSVGKEVNKCKRKKKKAPV